MRANLAALASSATGPINIGTAVETNVNDLYATLAQAAGVKTAPQYASARPGEQRRSVISPARAEKLLGWKPEVGLRDGLRETFRYFKERAGQFA